MKKTEIDIFGDWDPWENDLDPNSKEFQEQFFENSLSALKEPTKDFTRTTSECAAEWDICRNHITDRCRAGSIRAIKKGRDWFIHKDQPNPRIATTRRKQASD